MREDIKPILFGAEMSTIGDAEPGLRRKNERLLVRIAELERRLGAFATSSLVAGDACQPSHPEAESGGNDDGHVRRNPTAEALRRSELRCCPLLETAVDGILLLDTTGLVDCNQSAAHIYGLAKEDLIGRSPTDFSPEFQPDGQPSAEAFAMRAAAALAGEGQHFEWVSRRVGGALFDMDVTLARAGEAGSTLLLAIFRDVTERRYTERRLRESEGRFQIT